MNSNISASANSKTISNLFYGFCPFNLISASGSASTRLIRWGNLRLFKKSTSLLKPSSLLNPWLYTFKAYILYSLVPR